MKFNDQLIVLSSYVHKYMALHAKYNANNIIIYTELYTNDMYIVVSAISIVSVYFSLNKQELQLKEFIIKLT